MKHAKHLAVIVALIAWALWMQRAPELIAFPLQQANTNPNLVVSTCGTPPSVFPAAGERAPGTVNTDGQECSAATVTATVDTAGLAVSVSSGAATSGVTGTPIFVEVTTAQPVYTAGGFRAPSMDMNGLFRVNCLAGCTAASTDADDGSVAAGQTASLSVPLNYGFNGTAWERFRIVSSAGFAGGALVTTQVTTSGLIGAVSQSGNWSTRTQDGSGNAVTSVAVGSDARGLGVVVLSGSALTVTATNLDVQSGGADLATEATAAGILTSANFAAAFGTAGTADSQVITVQGPVASGAASTGNPVLTGALSGSNLTALTMSPVNSGLETSPAGRTAVVTITSAVTATGASAPTDSAMVTVAAGTRVVVYRVVILCGSTVSTAVTATMGFGTATIPSVTGKIASMPATTASAFQGYTDNPGYPNIIGMGASDEDLRLTMSAPTGGQCTVSVTYTTEDV